MSATIIAFPEEAIYREVPTLETATTRREREALIDPLSPEAHRDLETHLARDLFAAIMSRNRHSTRPNTHPKAFFPTFGEPVAHSNDRDHLLELTRSRRQLDWLIDRIERKQARAKAKR